jgi:hypothetical protein
MTRRAAQLNIRSDAARARVAELVRETGKSATQVVEEAVIAYRPPPPAERPAAPEGMEWRGRFLVMKPTGGPPITTEQLLQAIDDAREDRARHILGEDVD